MTLYNILVTRKDVYSALLLALWETNQVAAYRSLKMGDLSETSPEKRLESIYYDKSKIIGNSGSRTVVYRGRFGDRDVAVKKLWLKPEVIDNVFKETEVISTLEPHTNVVRYFCSQRRNDYVIIALELGSITLTDWMTKRETLQHISHLEILSQITLGIDYLHGKHILHCNLKPENILIFGSASKSCVKLTDFGEKLCQQKFLSRPDFLSTGWFAPEILRSTTNNEDLPAFVSRTLI